MRIVTGNFEKRNWKKDPHLGHQFKREGVIYGDKRCDWCGKWMTWKSTDAEKLKRVNNWKEEYGVKPVVIGCAGHNTDFKQDCIACRMTRREVRVRYIVTSEPVHCGSQACQDYHHAVLTKPNVHEVEREDHERRMKKLFLKLKKRSLLL